VAANVNMSSDFPRHHRSTSPDRAEVLMVALVTIASVVVCGWIAVWLLSHVGAPWLRAVAGLPVAMLPASIGTVILRWHRRRAASSDRTPRE
jgi:uncharacterized membrane protein YfcA